MSAVHESIRLYCEVRDLAITAQIAPEKIGKANLTYAHLHACITAAKANTHAAPALQDAIMNLPMQLISDLDVATGYDDVREAILSLPEALMDSLSIVINFEATEMPAAK